MGLIKLGIFEQQFQMWAGWQNRPGVNVIKVLHLYFTRVAIVSLAENNNCTCKLQVQNFYKIDPCTGVYTDKVHLNRYEIAGDCNFGQKKKYIELLKQKLLVWTISRNSTWWQYIYTHITET